MRRLIKDPLFSDPSVSNSGIEVYKEEIMKILFHRGRMLLLDHVTISSAKAVGRFTVPAENCEGHEPMPGLLVMRGVEICEMGFQLLGIVLAKNHNPELFGLLRDKAFAAREITGAKFNGFVTPGKQITLEVAPDIYIDDVADTLKIDMSGFIAKIDGRKSAAISSLSIVAFDPSKISSRSHS